jgi:hypothetical protein
LFLFIVFVLFFFTFFVLSHSIMRGAQFVFQRERWKIHQYFTTVKLYTLSELYETLRTRETLSHKGEKTTDILARDKITHSYCVSVCMKEIWKRFCNFNS